MYFDRQRALVTQGEGNHLQEEQYEIKIMVKIADWWDQVAEYFS